MQEATTPHLLWVGDKVDGRVVPVIFLQQAEGELVINQEAVCGEKEKPDMHWGRSLQKARAQGEHTAHSIKCIIKYQQLVQVQ